ncbi:two-component system sensor histidine kinase NtrB [Desulfosporosinus meridiei]|uniref:histidine kinase n=1 Tax=Desulfosporosinus meridiei (strain ATCC BAA-275 / DSM 13257 / KCTC 12902 / NCIMB 13706 / S10) TaxID=768704 RepID=J7J0Z0_DESMD|nr:ATP-binding protein [Desulfosporosinus meridiei]AFQ44636.1 signal transduction histidine kinase [Desulfosporosinus meridiei DSM 13257]
MVPLKFRFHSFHRQWVFNLFSVFFLVCVVLCYYLPISQLVRITLEFITFTILVVWFEPWFTSWGKVWIIASTLLILGSYLNPVLPSGPLMLAHVFFLLVMMLLFNHTEKQKLRLHEHHLKTIRVLLRQHPPLIQTADYTNEAIIILDNLGTILDINAESSILLSLPESSLVGKSIYNVLGILPNAQPTNIPENGDFNWTQQGVTKYLKFRTRPLLDRNKPSGTLVTLFDISESINRLENELQIEKLSIVSQVSAGLAHEIRNPLTTIKGFMQLITPEQWPEVFRPYQVLILDEIETINQLLNKFILITNPSAPHFEKLNLLECISSLTEATIPYISKYGVFLDVECPSQSVYVMGDREQLHQALMSIVNNGVEASPLGGKVSIQLTQNESWVSISVTDDGPGIPETLRSKILDPFFTTHEEGTGLGLTIAQQIILTHHGKLHFSDSSITTGTVVTISLPRLDFTDTLSARVTD